MLLSPRNDQTGANPLPLETRFSWTECTDPDGDEVFYYLVVEKWNQSAYENVCANYEPRGNRSRVLQLWEDSFYRWYVFSVDVAHASEGATDWYAISQIRFFKTEKVNDPPNTPELSYPFNDPHYSNPINGRVAFRWNERGDPEGDSVIYWLEIFEWDEEDQGWFEILKGYVGSRTSWQVEMLPSHYYAWRLATVTPATYPDNWFSFSDWYYFVSRWEANSRIVTQRMTEYDASSCNKPSFNSRFYRNTVGQIWHWFQCSQVAPNDRVTRKWYGPPRGDLYQESTVTIDWTGSGCFWDPISIRRGSEAQNRIGWWRVDVFYNNRKQVEEYFYLHK